MFLLLYFETWTIDSLFDKVCAFETFAETTVDLTFAETTVDLQYHWL